MAYLFGCIRLHVAKGRKDSPLCPSCRVEIVSVGRRGLGRSTWAVEAFWTFFFSTRATAGVKLFSLDSTRSREEPVRLKPRRLVHRMRQFQYSGRTCQGVLVLKYGTDMDSSVQSAHNGLFMKCNPISTPTATLSTCSNHSRSSLVFN